MEIGQPVTLSRLPKSPYESGTTKVAPVYSIRAGQKRKRHEICAAVDGDSVNIYDAQGGRTLASYPVPPNSTFCCKPCIVRMKQNSSSSAFSKTFCVIDQKGIRIQRFDELIETSTPPTAPHVQLPDIASRDAVLQLEVVANGPRHSQDQTPATIVVIQKDATIISVPEDFSSSPTNLRLPVEGAPAQVLLLAAQALSLAEAEKSILKSRADITQILPSDAILIAALFRFKNEAEDNKIIVRFGLWSVSRDGLIPKHTVAKLLFSNEIPLASRWLSRHVTDYELDVTSSTLLISFPQGFMRYAVASPATRLVADVELSKVETGLLSAKHLSRTLTAFSTQSSSKIYDSEYHSVQAETAFERKRKRSANSMDAPITFATYFPRLGRLVGVRKSQLLGVDLRMKRQGSSTAGLLSTPALADSLGKGLKASLQSAKLPLENMKLGFGQVDVPAYLDTSQWTALRQRLDALSQESDTTKFQAALEEEIRREEKQFSQADTNRTETLGSASTMPAQLIDYAMDKIFEFDEAGGISVRLYCIKTIAWLISHDLLYRARLEEALTPDLGLTKTPHITPASIATALMQADPSFELLNQYIQLCGARDTPELIATIKVLLKLTLNSAQPSEPTRILEIQSRDSMNNTQSIGHTTEDLVSEQIILRSSNKSTFMYRSLAVGVGQLGKRGAKSISSLVRAGFTQSEVLALIQFIRQQLFRSGHTQSVGVVEDVLDGESFPMGTIGLSIDSIVRLLCGCVDGVGPMGFSLQSDPEEFIDTIIPDLRSEVSRALEALDEAVALQGTLRETLRFADSVGRTSLGDASSKRDATGREQPRSGTIVTLYREPDLERGDLETVDGTLPLSLRAEQVSPTKRRKGGGQVLQRSARERLAMESRQLGRYSLERLVL